MRKFKQNIKNTILIFLRGIKNILFFLRFANLKSKKKIIYAITPTPNLRNVGDQAQVVAIKRWFRKHFPNLPVIELDKNESIYSLGMLKRLISPEDIIFLHSGGNLGDRGVWSEAGRREVIRSFPNHKIISLPQTIYFSETLTGLNEKKISQDIYSRHAQLTIIGRDPESGRLAKELFPKANTFSAPDYVLSLELDRESIDEPYSDKRVLMCLRNDDESILGPEDRDRLKKMLPMNSDFFDTSYDKKIFPKDREQILHSTLKHISRYSLVVTDRYHGVIFAVLLKKPCIVLRTVDHKLISAFEWFKDVSFVKFAKSLDEVSLLAQEMFEISDRNVPDWNKLYFDVLPEKIGLKPL